MSIEDLLDKEAKRQGLAAPAPMADVEPQRARTALQGLTLGFADELEARARSMLFEDRPYEEIRDEIRGQVQAYQQANPGEALTYELLGGVAPTVAMFLVPGGQAAGAANIARMGAGQMIKRGAAEGGVAGYGYSQEEDLPGIATDVGIGTVAGGVLSPIAGKVMGGATNKAMQVADWIRTNVGQRPSDMAVAELQRLAKGTGKSVDEIVNDIASGKIMAENRTLAAAVRAIRSKDVEEAGMAPSMIDKTLRSRAEETAGIAGRAVERELYPEASARNVFETINASDDLLKAAEKRGYRDVFRANPELAPGQSKAMETLAQRFPNMADELNKFYSENSLVPLFKTGANKEITLARMPSLEDAEVMYRLLRDEASARWTAGKGQTAEPVSKAANTLKRMLDMKYPELKDVRKEAAKRLGAKDAFAEGRKAFGRDADEVEFEFNAMTPEAQKNYRAGVLAAFKNKMRRSPTAAGRASEPSRQEGAILKIVAGPRYEEALQKPLEIAGEAAEAKSRILYGSMTAPEAAAEKAIGSGQIGMGEIMQAFGGDPLAMASIIGKKLQGSMPQLGPKDYEAVTKVLLSEDPNFVGKMLRDEVSMGDIKKKIEPILRIAGEAGRAGATRVGAGGTVEKSKPLTNPLLEALRGQLNALQVTNET